MNSPIINQNIGASKPRDDVLVHERGCMYSCVCLDSLGLRPLGQVLGSNHNVSHTF